MTGVFHEIDKGLFLWLNGSDSMVMDYFALTETSHFAWLPFLLALLYIILKSNPFKKAAIILGVMTLLFLLSDTMVSTFVQPTIARLRPGMDLHFVHLVDMVNQTTGGIHGMCSHQAAKAMALSLFLSLLFRSLPFFFLSMGWTFLRSYLLVYIGYYFPSDIFVGLLWGALVALCLYLLYVRIEKNALMTREFKSDQYTHSGYSYMDMNLVLVACLLNLIGIILVSFII